LNKQCRICGDIKHISKFELRNDTKKHRTECKSCRSISNAIRLYGITREFYLQMQENQNSRCAICNATFEESNNPSHDRLVVDHNHKTGKVRGLLCSKCNFALGNFDEDVDKLLNAVEYLRKHKH
jgi:hypothetical protein